MEAEHSLIAALLQHVGKPPLVPLEEICDRTLHPGREGLVLGRQHAAKAHPLTLKYVGVEVGIGIELARADLHEDSSIFGQSSHEPNRIAGDQRLSQVPPCSGSDSGGRRW